MKLNQPIPRKALHNKGSVKNNENVCHKYFLSIKPIKLDNDKDKTVKSTPPLFEGKGKTFSFQDQLYHSFQDQVYLLVDNKPQENIIYWRKDVQDKL